MQYYQLANNIIPSNSLNEFFLFSMFCRVWVGGFSLLCVFQFLRWNFPHCFPGLGGWAAAERATIKEGGRIISRLLLRLPPARQQNNKEIQSLE